MKNQIEFMLKNHCNVTIQTTDGVICSIEELENLLYSSDEETHMD